jgi:hypothetical protein
MKSPWGTAKNLKETMMEAEFNHLNHATWERKYHVVFTPKYRKKLLFGRIKAASGSGVSRSRTPQGMPDRGGASDARSRPHVDFDTSEIFGGADHRIHEREELDMDRTECRTEDAEFSPTNSGRADTLSRPLAGTSK